MSLCLDRNKIQTAFAQELRVDLMDLNSSTGIFEKIQEVPFIAEIH